MVAAVGQSNKWVHKFNMKDELSPRSVPSFFPIFHESRAYPLIIQFSMFCFIQFRNKQRRKLRLYEESTKSWKSSTHNWVSYLARESSFAPFPLLYSRCGKPLCETLHTYLFHFMIFLNFNSQQLRSISIRSNPCWRLLMLEANKVMRDSREAQIVCVLSAECEICPCHEDNVTFLCFSSAAIRRKRLSLLKNFWTKVSSGKEHRKIRYSRATNEG